MVGRGNQNVFFIQMDASNIAEFKISKFKISRVYYIKFCCPRSSLNTVYPTFFKLSINVNFKLSINIYDHNISAKLDYQQNRFGNSRVMALDLQKLLDKLLVCALYLTSFDQYSSNFIQMLRTI